MLTLGRGSNIPGAVAGPPARPLASARSPVLRGLAAPRARSALSLLVLHVAGVDCQDLVHFALGFVEVTGIDCALRAREVSDQLANDGRG